MAQEDRTSSIINSTVSTTSSTAKEAVYEATHGPVKSFFAMLFAPVVRENEVARKGIVVTAERQDELVGKLDVLANRLASKVGAEQDGQSALASPHSARDVVYDATRSWWKTGLGVVFPWIGGTIRSNEVLKKSVYSSAERREDQMAVIDTKLDKVAAKLGIDTTPIGETKPGFPPRQSVTAAVRDATHNPGNTAGAVALSMAAASVTATRIPVVSVLAAPFIGLGYILRKNQVTREAVDAAAQHRDEQIGNMVTKMEKIAEKLGMSLDDILIKDSPAFAPGREGILEAGDNKIGTAAAAFFGRPGSMFRENQSVRQVVGTDANRHELQLNAMIKAMESMVDGAGSGMQKGKAQAASFVERDMNTFNSVDIVSASEKPLVNGVAEAIDRGVRTEERKHVAALEQATLQDAASAAIRK